MQTFWNYGVKNPKIIFWSCSLIVQITLIDILKVILIAYIAQRFNRGSILSPLSCMWLILTNWLIVWIKKQKEFFENSWNSAMNLLWSKQMKQISKISAIYIFRVRERFTKTLKYDKCEYSLHNMIEEYKMKVWTVYYYYNYYYYYY